MMRALIAAMIVLAGLGAARVAHAEPADVPALIKLIDTQPADMERGSWREKRRDAAKKLAASRDKRAVAELMKLAETETFDVIGEIAIEGLGTAGDPQAIPTLQKIYNDPARDKTAHELAKKALARLGAKPEAAPPPTPVAPPPDTAPEVSPPPPPDATPATPATATDAGAALVGPRDPGTGSVLLGGGAPAVSVPDAPTLPDDVIAAYDRLTFAGGTASLGYNTAQKRFDFDGDVSALYQKRIERESMAWGYDGSAHLVTGLVNPEGRPQTRGAQLDATADGELRLYTGPFYGIGRAVGEFQLNYTSDVGNDPNNDVKDTRFEGDLAAAIGGGYGRVIDVGATIRVRRLSRTLEAARALGKPIDAATSKKLQLTWWSLRRERTSYQALLATIAVLREAGILLSDPDASLTYEILNVLRDSQLYQRLDGYDVNLTFSEGYLDREATPNGVISGRDEQLLLAASYGRELDDDKLQVQGTAYGRLRVLAPNGQPSPWAAGATGSITRYEYTEHGDPVGAIDLTVNLAISDDDQMGTDAGTTIGAQLGWTWWINQASGLRLAANVAQDSGVLFFGATATASYGFLDGLFAQ
jgi:hypothetical protein